MSLGQRYILAVLANLGTPVVGKLQVSGGIARLWDLQACPQRQRHDGICSFTTAGVLKLVTTDIEEGAKASRRAEYFNSSCFFLFSGVIIHGISRLCASSYDPFKPREREVTIHRRFVKQGTFLFVLYFFNLSVLATYLPQDHLKFIPLLTCLFTLAQ